MSTNPLPERLTPEKYTGLYPGWRYGSQAAGEPWMVTIPKDLAHAMAPRYNAHPALISVAQRVVSNGHYDTLTHPTGECLVCDARAALRDAGQEV